MKKSLLATVAAVALFAGTGLVAAENAKDQQGAKPSSQSEMHKGADTKGGAAMKSEPKTTGSGANEMKSEPKAGQAATKGKADNKAEMKSDNKSKPSTTGAGAADEKAGSKTGANGKGKASTTGAGEHGTSTSGANEMKSGAQSPNAKSPSAAQGTTSSPSSAQGTTNSPSTNTAQGSAGAQGGSVNLTSEQKTQIRTTVLQSSSAPKVSRSSINFNVAVGTVVPRSVHFVTVPDTLVRIHPAWRGYSYFIVDEEIIIVEPRTLKIIAVLTV